MLKIVMVNFILTKKHTKDFDTKVDEYKASVVQNK